MIPPVLTEHAEQLYDRRVRARGLVGIEDLLVDLMADETGARAAPAAHATATAPGGLHAGGVDEGSALRQRLECMREHLRDVRTQAEALRKNAHHESTTRNLQRWASAKCKDGARDLLSAEQSELFKDIVRPNFVQRALSAAGGHGGRAKRELVLNWYCEVRACASAAGARGRLGPAAAVWSSRGPSCLPRTARAPAHAHVRTRQAMRKCKEQSHSRKAFLEKNVDADRSCARAA